MDLYQKMFGRFCAPNEEGADGGGGKVDRGDDFVPTDDDAPEGDKKESDEEGEDDKKEPEEGDDKKEPEKKGKMVPEERMQQAIRKHKDKNAALEARIKELEGAVSTTKVSKDIGEVEKTIDELQDEYEDALADNNKDKMKDLRTKIRAQERSLIELKADERAKEAKRETLEELRYEAAIAKVEQDYPVINVDSDDFDEEKAQEVLDLRNAMMKAGVAATKALQRAAKYVLGDPSDGKSKEDIQATKQEREEAARKKAAKANKEQPADTDGLGLDSDKAGGKAERGKPVARMSQEEFSKLSEEELAKRRGDTL